MALKAFSRSLYNLLQLSHDDTCPLTIQECKHTHTHTHLLLFENYHLALHGKLVRGGKTNQPAPKRASVRETEVVLLQDPT